jgi:FMN phosphatase YigB (HAD superfamily)
MLLVDFDGVVLRNPRCMRYQSDQSAKFVQKVTGMSLKSSEALNHQCYPRYGHTVTMLNKLFNNITTLEEYNDFVFEPRKISEVLDSELDLQTRKHFRSFEPLFDRCTRAQINTAIFTNASLSWVEYCSNKISPTLLKSIQVVYPRTTKEMKPDPRAYDNVELLFPDKEEYWFVDDSKANLIEPSKRDNWIPFYYTQSSSMEDMTNHFGLL